ncbi:MAG: hypothetical protein QM743_08790 [Chitinophagaceae bacterium]
MTKIFSKRHSVLFFDDGKTDSLPDCYFRKGNRVLLIEIKDAYFPSSATDSFSFEKIKKAIDEKYNSPKKGIGQIIKQIKSLKQNPYEKEPPYKKVSSLKIYPIIVYTDSNFNMLGVNRYLSQQFQLQQEVDNLSSGFKKIFPLTLINLNFLIENMVVLRDGNNDFFKLVEDYHQYVAIYEKKNRKDKSSDESMFNTFLSFYDFYQTKYRLGVKNYLSSIKELLETLDLVKFGESNLTRR